MRRSTRFDTCHVVAFRKQFLGRVRTINPDGVSGTVGRALSHPDPEIPGERNRRTRRRPLLRVLAGALWHEQLPSWPSRPAWPRSAWRFHLVRPPIRIRGSALGCSWDSLPWEPLGAPDSTLAPVGRLAAPLLYTGSTLALILAAGGSSAGVGLVVLSCPSCGPPSISIGWKSFVVVVAVMAIEFVTTYKHPRVTSWIPFVSVGRWRFSSRFGAPIVLSIYEIRVNYARSDRSSRGA